jgi:hypothetical protein
MVANIRGGSGAGKLAKDASDHVTIKTDPKIDILGIYK